MIKFSTLGTLCLTLFCGFLFSFQTTYAQNVNVQSVALTTSPATSCTNTSITVSGMLSAANYGFLGTPFTVSGNTITINIDYSVGLIILPAFMPFTHNVNVGMLAPGTYTVVANGNLNGVFQSSLNTTITVVSCCPAVPSFTMSNSSVCPGDTVQLTNTSTGQTSQTWYQNGSFLSNNLDVNVNLSTPGTYTYKLVVTDGNCSDSTEQTLTVNPLPNVNLGNDTTVCSGVPYMLNAGFGFSNYAWSDGTTTQTNFVSSVGQYIVTVTDNNGCVNSDTVNITSVLPAPTVNLGPDLALCQGATQTLDAGAGFSSYAWSNGGNMQTNSISTMGSISVTVTDGNGCVGSDTFTVTSITPYDTVNLGPDTAICPGASITLDAGSVWTGYNWAHGPTTQTTVVSSGSYAVTATAAFGCDGVGSINITELTLAPFSLGPDTAGCAGLTITANGNFTSYSWSTGATTNSISVPTTGMYSVTVTDPDGCQQDDTIQVTAFSGPGIDLGADTILCHEDDSLIFMGSPSAVAHQWIFNGDTFTTTDVVIGPGIPLGANTLYLTITDTNGCTSTDSIRITGVVCIGLEENSLATGISVYPNPVRDQLFISSKVANGPTQLTLIDAQGRMVLQRNLNLSPESQSINLEQLSPGLYFLQLHQEKGRAVFPVSVQ